ncbi:MAG: helix-turn-helix domain containing protein [Eubacteriales bacterium]|nr:helix-turn-helix domain containing protein [Eubacteriales bacterium]
MNEPFISEEGGMYMDERLTVAYEAATRLFITKGFKATQIQDVAKECGMATGSTYALFTGKKALLHFCLTTSFRYGVCEDTALPVEECTEEELNRQERVWMNSMFTRFQGISQRTNMMGMLHELYDELVRSRGAILLLENNGEVLGALSRYYWQQREKLIALLNTELEGYIAKGELCHMTDSRTAVLAIVTTLAMWALHSSFRYPGLALSEEEKKKIAIDLLASTYGELGRKHEGARYGGE